MDKARFRRKEGKFVAEGIKMFEEAEDERIEEVYVREDTLEKLDKEILDKLKRHNYEVLSNQVYQKISDTVTPQGIMTILNIKNSSHEDIFSKENGLFVLLENIQDPGNIGTIIRTAEGAGVAGIIMSNDCVDIYNPKVIRSTMGSIYRMQFAYTDSIVSCIDTCKKKGIATYACALDRNAKSYDEFDYKKASAFIIGNEGNGLKEESIKAADNTCFIPMLGKVESLNASVAASIMMYEGYRQRRK